MDRPRLPFTNRWMFDFVMLDETICKEVIRCALGIDAEHIEYLNTEQVLEPSVDARGVRMDVYARGSGRVYDIEMQATPEPLLGQRFRYYQAMLDHSLLPRGCDYDDLPESFILFICAYDPFDEGLPLYLFEPSCLEVPSLDLGCGAHWVALNALAWHDLPEGALRDLLHYTKTGHVGQSSLVRRIDARVTEGNKDRKWVDKVLYCISTIGENDARRARILERQALKKGLAEGRAKGLEEGRAKGLAEGLEEGLAEGRAEGEAEATARYNALLEQLLAENRVEDMHRMVDDEAYREALFGEFQL